VKDYGIIISYAQVFEMLISVLLRTNIFLLSKQHVVSMIPSSVANLNNAVQ